MRKLHLVFVIIISTILSAIPFTGAAQDTIECDWPELEVLAKGGMFGATYNGWSMIHDIGINEKCQIGITEFWANGEAYPVVIWQVAEGWYKFSQPIPELYHETVLEYSTVGYVDGLSAVVYTVNPLPSIAYGRFDIAVDGSVQLQVMSDLDNANVEGYLNQSMESGGCFWPSRLSVIKAALPYIYGDTVRINFHLWDRINESGDCRYGLAQVLAEHRDGHTYFITLYAYDTEQGAQELYGPYLDGNDYIHYPIRAMGNAQDGLIFQTYFLDGTTITFHQPFDGGQPSFEVGYQWPEIIQEAIKLERGNDGSVPSYLDTLLELQVVTEIPVGNDRWEAAGKIGDEDGWECIDELCQISMLTIDLFEGLNQKGRRAVVFARLGTDQVWQISEALFTGGDMLYGLSILGNSSEEYSIVACYTDGTRNVLNVNADGEISMTLTPDHPECEV